MRGKTVEQQLRFMLMAFSGLAYIGTVIELWFVEHFESVIQVIPFILSGLGFLMVIVMHKKPVKRVVYSLRYVSAFIALGGLFGVYEHMRNNIGFEMEVHPDYTFGFAFWEALGGATPLMAPGILFFAALLAIASTWRHPVLKNES